MLETYEKPEIINKVSAVKLAGVQVAHHCEPDLYPVPRETPPKVDELIVRLDPPEK